jgi:hypothetical protein
LSCHFKLVFATSILHPLIFVSKARRIPLNLYYSPM